MKTLEKALVECAVIGYPDFVPLRRFVPAGLIIKKEFSVYVHKSLTRKIVVIKRKT